MSPLFAWALGAALLAMGGLFFQAHLWANGTRRPDSTDYDNHGGE